MPRLPRYDTCKRCGQDLEGVSRHLGLCAECIDQPARVVRVKRGAYSFTEARPWQRRLSPRR